VALSYRSQCIAQRQVTAEVWLLELVIVSSPVILREVRYTLPVKAVGEQSDCIGL